MKDLTSPTIKTVTPSKRIKLSARSCSGLVRIPWPAGSIPIRINICSIYRASYGHSPARRLNTRALTRLMDTQARHSGFRRTYTLTKTRWSRCFNARFQRRTNKRSLPLSSKWIAPSSEPHWYLPMIGVDPAKQGNGYGSALLKHALERCDGEGKLAYLESSSPKSVPLYQRHGFQLVGTIQVGSHLLFRCYGGRLAGPLSETTNWFLNKMGES